uniref:UDP-glucuronate decarboxylase n=1 Tax=Oryza punctata TaxID=4537 RepID=A0A0E0L1K1_ORYPU
MASELTYRGGVGGATQAGEAAAGGYSPKPSKPLAWLPRAARYAAGEHRPLFALAGMLLAAALFSLATPSSPTPATAATAGSTANPLARFSVEPSVNRQQAAARQFVGGKVPLGLKRKGLRVLVTGGAGFVGSHLVDRLVERGDSVIVVDNLFTGRKENVVHHFGNPNFEMIRHDVVEPILLEVDQIYHLACPASPVHYKYNPVKTIISFLLLLISSASMISCLDLDLTNVVGTLNMLGLAKRINARFLLTSTSEVYGDPLQHPQVETYWGNVNPIGVRSCYDEGKRTAETLTMDYHRGANLEVRIARIFNTYGPRMCIDDGRVVSNFVAQALRKEPLTVYGDGKQTRSFQYVSDLVEGLMRLMEGEHVGPFNLGNPGEFTMLELAKVVQDTIDPNAKIEFRPNTQDDPHKRKPDISRAKELLGWEPKIPLHKGLPLMVTDFRKRIFGDQDSAATTTGGQQG